MNKEKQIWFSVEDHKKIKVNAAKVGLSMRSYIMNLVRQDEAR